MNLIRVFLASGLLLSFTAASNAQSTLFGEAGTGQPTNTILGLLAGAATGAAVGQAVGGEDGWWIGSLVGSAVGGAAGNTIQTGHSRSYYHTSSPRYRYSSPRYSHRKYSRYRSCASPRYISYSSPVYVEEQVVVSRPANNAPYGFIEAGGRIKSPWSDFTMNLGGKTPGQIVYDGNTGQAFRIP